MKIILVSIISFYQILISGFLKNVLGVNKMCRQSLTCSEYAKIAISNDGVFRGLGKSAIRILKCQPFTKV